MKIFQKYLYLVLFILLFLFGITSGCKNIYKDKRFNENDIISYYFSAYTRTTNSSNEDLAYILREFSNYTITNKYSSWDRLKKDKHVFFVNIRTNVISCIYPIYATEEETDLAKNFLNSMILYDENRNPLFIYNFGHRISSVSTDLIIKINDYEYDKKTNK